MLDMINRAILILEIYLTQLSKVKKPPYNALYRSTLIGSTTVGYRPQAQLAPVCRGY